MEPSQLSPHFIQSSSPFIPSSPKKSLAFTQDSERLSCHTYFKDSINEAIFANVSIKTNPETHALSSRELSLTSQGVIEDPAYNKITFSKRFEKKPKMTENCELSKKLFSLGLSWENSLVEQLYCLTDYFKESIYGKEITYPAIFSGEATLKTNQKELTHLFELIVLPPDRAYLVPLSNRVKQENYLREKQENVLSGSAKKVSRAFCLHPPKAVAYASSQSVKVSDANKIPQDVQEAKYLKLLNGDPHFAKIYEIFYFKDSSKKGVSFDSQAILMKYYPFELCDQIDAILKRKISFSYQEKMNFSIRLLEAIEILHQKQIVHRDIKMENILLSHNTIEQPVLIDFGLSCGLHETRWLNINAGTLDYAAVELLSASRKEPVGLPLDMWSTACVLWIVWSGQYWPWSGEHSSWLKDKNKKEIDPEKFILMQKVDQTPPENKQSIIYLLWNMWRIDYKKRWTAPQALEFLKKIREEDYDHLSFSQYLKTVSNSQVNKK